MKSILRSVLSNWSVLGLNLIVGFALLPIMIRRLGTDAYGILVLMNTMVAYTSLLRGGLGGAVVQGVAAARGRSDAEEGSRVASSVASLYVLLGVLALFVGCGIAWAMPGWFNVAEHLVRPTRALALSTALLLAMQFPGSVFGGILYGLERFDRANLSIAVALVLRTAGLLIWVHNDTDLLELGLIQLGAGIVELGISAALAKASWPELKLRWRSPRSHESRRAGAFGLGNLTLNIAEKIVHDTDPIVVGSALSTHDVTIYNGGAALTRYTRLLLQEVTRVLGPAMSRLWAAGDIEGVRNTYLRMTRITLLVALPLIGYGLWIGPPLLRRWIGAELGAETEQAVWILRILLLPQLLTVPQAVATSVLWGMGRLKLPSIVFGLEAASNLVLSLILVRELGLIGVAIGTLVPVLFLQTWLLPRVAMREIELDAIRLWRESLFPILRLAPVVAAVGYGISRLTLETWPMLILTGVLALLVYAPFAWFLGLEAEERRHLSRALRGRLG